MALFLFVKNIKDGKPINLYNHGNMFRDFTYIDDIVKSIQLLLDKPPLKKDIEYPQPHNSWAPFQVFNIGNGDNIPLTNYIEAIESLLCKKAKINSLPMQPGDVESTLSDCSLLHEWINFKPNTDISYGIQKFIDWYQSIINDSAMFPDLYSCNVCVVGLGYVGLPLINAIAIAMSV